MSKIITRLLPLILLFLFHPAGAGAQQPARPPNLNSGDAVVTGFSGTSAPNPAQPRPAGKSAIDLTFINPDGPSARIVAIGRPGFVWDGRLFQAPKTFDVLARDTGQLFGVALDDQAAPNIYLAATSAFGLYLVGRGPDGQPERRKAGGPGTGWMKGQFGLDLQGDPGSIYRVDGKTGVVSLFTKVMLDGVPNPGPALGNLAYDVAHKQLFVSDLYTGMIHRFAIADGSEPGASYDHGVTGRSATNLAPMPFNPGNRPNIANSRFNSENPDTWGFAPPERRVWGLAVHEGRLFYSARNGAATDGPQIWSVGIQPDGSFAADARWELDVSAQPGPYPVSDIAFSQKGAMILAQRAPIAGAYDYSAFTRSGEPRVLRYVPRDPNDPPSPGVWKPVADEYAVGFAGSYRNGNGGVALGYGYGQDGALSATACEAVLWATGQNLRNNAAMRSQLEPGGPLLVDGLQGGPADAARSASAPPATSYFIDYDDKFDDAQASGHIGSVRILAQPCATPVAAAGTPGSSNSNPPYISGASTTPPGTPPNPPPPGPTYDLSIKKTAGQVTFDPKTLTWTVTFTVTVTNDGAPFSPGNTISINDPVPTGMAFTSATGAGWTCTGSLNCGYAFGSGVFNTSASLIPLTITATSTTPGSYTNCASVAASGLPETTYSNNRDCVTVDFKYPPNRIKVEKVNLDPSCTVELLCRFQIKVTNLDPWPFSGPVTIADNTTIPMNIAFTDVPCPTPPTSIPFSCTAPLAIPASGTLTFAVNGVIPAGSVPITGVHPDPINCATISNPPAGTSIVIPQDCKPYQVPCGFACHMTEPQIAQIKIEKNANSTQCTAGGLCSYTFTISNVSTTTATMVMPITFIDTMPVGATNYVSSTPPPWGCVPFGAGQIKCLHPPSSIPAGGQITITVTFQISPSYNQPTLTNCSEFFVGQGAVASLQLRSAAAMDASAMRAYLQSRGLSALPQSTSVVLQPDDKSCTTVNIVQPVGIRTTCTPPMVPGPVPGQCVCPLGTTLVGRECVKAPPPPPVCAPPLVPDPVAGQCICPLGTTLVGRECVPAGVHTSAPATCDPSTTLKRGDDCACRYPGMMKSSAGACMCIMGDFMPGRGCVRRIDCRLPMVSNAAGTACGCPEGTKQHGKECVRPTTTVCNPPAKLNRRGGCDCPKDTVAKSNGCVEREHRTPAIAPGDFIRNLPGGGRNNPGGPRGGGQGPTDLPGRR